MENKGSIVVIENFNWYNKLSKILKYCLNSRSIVDMIFKLVYQCKEIVYYMKLMIKIFT